MRHQIELKLIHNSLTITYNFDNQRLSKKKEPVVNIVSSNFRTCPLICNSTCVNIVWSMYEFRITKQESGGYRFELKGIKMLVDDYIVKDGKHFFTNPPKAIAYFDVESNLYGVVNEPYRYSTAEDFHDAMEREYSQFNNIAR